MHACWLLHANARSQFDVTCPTRALHATVPNNIVVVQLALRMERGPFKAHN